MRVAEPLPECELCGAPTKREAHERNGGLCSPCTTGIADTVRMLIPAGVTDLTSERERRRRLASADVALSDETVYVETYRPPVPGQLRIEEE